MRLIKGFFAPVCLLAAVLTLASCFSVPGQQPSSALKAQNAGNSVSASFQTSAEVPAELLAGFTRQAQEYSDEVSRRRELDFFKIHPQPVGLKLSAGKDSAWVLSYLGTALERNDLNVELRLLAGQSTALSLNYSGPVTLSRNALPALSDTKSRVSATQTPFAFRLLQGLPGNGVTDAYGDYLEGLARYLPYRYQAQPFEFDDGPLVYSVHYGQELAGFLFFNQRNYLRLGERKYADVQSVVMISPQRQILAAYSLIGFNPKTPNAIQGPAYRLESDARFGQLIEFGEL